MRKKFRNFSKKGTAAILTTAMVAGSLTTGFIINSDNEVEAATTSVDYSIAYKIGSTVDISKPMYYYDFEDTGVKTATNKGSVSDASASVVGTYNKIENINDGEHKGVFNNGVGETATLRQNYLSLPSDVLKKVANTGTKEMSIGFWVKGDVNDTCNWSSLFTIQKVDNSANTWPCFAIYKRGGAYLNAWGVVEASQKTKLNYMSTDAGTGDGKWHYVTVTATENTINYYVDGENYQSSESNVASNLFAGDMLDVATSVSLGGNQLFTWGDTDVCAYFDDLAIYNEALTPEEIYYLYTGIAPAETNKTELNNAITSANAIKTELYTDATVKVFNEKLVAANAVKANGSAEQAEADTATKELVAAQKALVKLSVNLDDGVVLNSDMTSATSIVDVDANTVSFNEYTITTEGAAKVTADGYIQLASEASATETGVKIDGSVLAGANAEDGFTISAKIDFSQAPASDWNDFVTMTNSKGELLLRNTYGFINWIGKANEVPGKDCKNGFAWDSCKSYAVNTTKTFTYTVSKDGISVYVDGVLACRKTDASLFDIETLLSSVSNIYIGKASNVKDADTQGKLSQVVIYNRAVNAAEAEALATTAPTVTTTKDSGTVNAENAKTYAQYKKVSDNNYTVRIISEVAMADVTKYTGVGFRCTRTRAGAGENYYGMKVYKSIKANGKTVTAADGKYFVILEINNVVNTAKLYAEPVYQDVTMALGRFGKEVTVDMTSLLK